MGLPWDSKFANLLDPEEAEMASKAFELKEFLPLAHAQGDIEKHKANVEIYLTNPAGIGEHSNVLEAVEEELNMIAKYQDQIEVIQKYFKR